VVVEGRSGVDESMLTGEPVPVTKQALIVQMVARAQRSKAPMQRMADVVAGYFVVSVVAIALLTFFAS